MKDLKVEFTNYKTYDMRCSPTSKLRIGSNLLEPQDKSYYNLKEHLAYTTGAHTYTLGALLRCNNV